MIKWLKRILLFLLMAIVASFALAFIFISPITKYLIEKYDKEYTNREITIDKLWINLLTGSVRINGITIHELNGADSFFTATEIYLNVEEHKLLAGIYEIEKVSLNQASCVITRNGRKFNVDDMIEKLQSQNTSSANSEPVQYKINSVKINNCSFTYDNIGVGNKMEIDQIDLQTNNIAWDVDQQLFNYKFRFKSGGVIKGQTGINKKSLNYFTNIDIKQFDLHAWFYYLKDLMNIKALEGKITTTMVIKGNLNEPEAVALKGDFNLDDFAVVDPLNNPILSCKLFEMNIDSIDIKAGRYQLQEIIFNQPFIKAELYNNGNNFLRLLNDTVSSIDEVVASSAEEGNLFTMMVSYVEDIEKNYAVTNYSCDKIDIINGHVEFNDYTLNEHFNANITNLTMNARNLKRSNKQIELAATGILNQSGKLAADLKLDPLNFKNLKLDYTINDLRVSDFNPYMVYNVAFPFLGGIVVFKSSNQIDNNFLVSSNDLQIIKVELGGKVNDKPLYRLPMKLAISLLKDKNGDIKLNIPIEGDLSDPKYKIGKVIWQIIKNIFIKAVNAPAKLLSNVFKGNEEELSEIKFNYLQNEITQKQYQQLNKIAEVLENKPELNVELMQLTNYKMEEEFFALFLVKKKFYENQHRLTLADSISKELTDSIKAVDQRDSAFIKFVDEQLNTNDNLTPIQEKCREIIGEDILREQLMQSINRRDNVLLDYLVTQKKIPASRIRVITNTDQQKSHSQTVSKYIIKFFVDGDNQPDIEN